MTRLPAPCFWPQTFCTRRPSRPTGARAGALVALGVLLVLGAPAEAQTLRKGDQVAGTATVVDGQSFDIKSDRFKLWGVDTPDRNTGCYRNGRRWRPTADARSAMHRCVDGKTVTCKIWRLERKWFRDIYVSECWTDDGTDVGECMIRSGWATDYTCYSGGYYREQEVEAKKKGIGLWSCDNGPGTRRWGRGGRGAPCETPRYKPGGPTAKQL